MRKDRPLHVTIIVRTPSTWLLHTGWQRHGEIDAHAVPSRPAP